MKKFFAALVLTFGVGVGVQAQQSLTADDYSFDGTETYMSQGVSNAGTLETEAMKTGASVSWDLSSATPEGNPSEGSVEYVDPSTTPYADEFPDATHASTTDDNFFSYFVFNSERYELLGGGSETSIMKYTGFVMAEFPFDFSEKIDGTYSIATTTEFGTSTTEGNRSVEYSGYGSVMLPQGTFEDVIQMKTVQTSETEFFSSTTTNISFFQLGTGSVANYSKSVTQVTGQGETVNHSFSYNPAEPTSRKANAAPALLNLYPNPSTGDVNLTYVQREAGQATVSVFDLMGRVVFSQTQENAVGIQNLKLSLDAPAGVYTIEVSTASGSVVQKLILN